MLKDESIINSTTVCDSGEARPARRSGQIQAAHRDYLLKYHAALINELASVEVELESTQTDEPVQSTRECMDRPERASGTHSSPVHCSRGDLLRNEAILGLYIITLQLDGDSDDSQCRKADTLSAVIQARDQLSDAIGMLQSL